LSELGSNLLWWIGGFVVAVGMLVAVHEFGHFWVARRLGFKVERFKIGFGKTLWSRQLANGQTEFAIGAIPLGGYVKMLDEREGPVAAEDLPASFTRRPVWQRILVLLAGPGFNILFAVLVYSLISGLPSESRRLIVGAVAVDSPADRAGLEVNDELVSLNGKPVRDGAELSMGLIETLIDVPEATLGVRRGTGTRAIDLKLTDAEQRAITSGDQLDALGYDLWMPDSRVVIYDVQEGGARAAGLQPADRVLAIDGAGVRNIEAARQIIERRGGSTLNFRIVRAGHELDVPVAVRADTEGGRRVGRIGVHFDARPEVAERAPFPESMRVRHSLGPIDALGAGVATTYQMSKLTVKVLWKMLVGKVSARNLGGPVTIAKAAGDSARLGILAFLAFLGYVSVSLAILNLLPVPVLDGGQIVYQLAEAVRGRPLSERAQIIGQQIGLAMIVVLLSFVLVNDFTRNL
jgi:regulator of sigma E protease